MKQVYLVRILRTAAMLLFFKFNFDHSKNVIVNFLLVIFCSLISFKLLAIFSLFPELHMMILHRVTLSESKPTMHTLHSQAFKQGRLCFQRNRDKYNVWTQKSICHVLDFYVHTRYQVFILLGYFQFILCPVSNSLAIKEDKSTQITFISCMQSPMWWLRSQWVTKKCNFEE